jgi:DNA transformation protein and related proteins
MSSLVDALPDLFRGLGPVRVRRMFGVQGIYADGLFIGLVDEGTLYLKADRVSAPTFEAQGLQRFSYTKHGRVTPMSFYAAPGEVYDDPDEALRWGRLAVEAALRARD